MLPCSESNPYPKLIILPPPLTKEFSNARTSPIPYAVQRCCYTQQDSTTVLRFLSCRLKITEQCAAEMARKGNGKITLTSSTSKGAVDATSGRAEAKHLAPGHTNNHSRAALSLIFQNGNDKHWREHHSVSFLRGTQASFALYCTVAATKLWKSSYHNYVRSWLEFKYVMHGVFGCRGTARDMAMV